MENTVSVALTTKNGEPYLEDQLESIRYQTLPPDEVVVCDDHSSDNTLSILRKFQKEVSFRVRIYENETVLGSQKNFIKAISLCEGSHVKLCDQDNVWDPAYLERIVGLFKAKPDIGLVITNAEVVDHGLKPLGFTLWEFSRFNKKLQKHLTSTDPHQVMLKKNVGYGFTLAFKSQFCPFLMHFPEQWSYDGWISMTISGLAKVGLIDETLVKYRQHQGQQKPFRVGEMERSPFSLSINRKNLLFERDLFEAALSHYKRYHPGELRTLIDDLQSKVLHIEKRLNLPSYKFQRLPTILKEARRGNYHRYSNGCRTIIKDVLRNE